jgi:hypothetical protein
LALLCRHLANPSASWSVGGWGAIGEFRMEADEPRELDVDALTVVTARGGLGITPVWSTIALEIRQVDRDRIEEIAFCLPAALCRGRRAMAFSERGPDRDALRAADRDGILFDLGLGVVHIDADIRVAPQDVTLLSTLRQACGAPLFDGQGRVAAAIRDASPARIFRSPLARLEVYAPIPAAGGVSPDGPHSHILPALLQQRRAHAPDSPIPDGWYCCLSLYPGLE